MKNLIAMSLLTLAVAAPVYAADAKAPAAKPDAEHAHHMMHEGGSCDAKHEGHEGMHGHGMMGDANMMAEANMHMLGALNLSDEQRAKINKLGDALHHDNWAKQGMINDETAKLRDLYQADPRDTAAISKEYQKLFDVKRQMIEAYLNTENQIEEVLTAEQRAKLKEMRSHMRQMYHH